MLVLPASQLGPNTHINAFSNNCNQYGKDCANIDEKAGDFVTTVTDSCNRNAISETHLERKAWTVEFANGDARRARPLLTSTLYGIESESRRVDFF